MNRENYLDRNPQGKEARQNHSDMNLFFYVIFVLFIEALFSGVNTPNKSVADQMLQWCYSGVAEFSRLSAHHHKFCSRLQDNRDEVHAN
jgi:hypothetical protein